mmetsp:Transcript_29857/g.75972  ORF Transcript_29857/g.75972 Transcript_29857/m.75972 type:complete len:242 (+) Transcript_29857:792-1517(+)
MHRPEVEGLADARPAPSKLGRVGEGDAEATSDWEHVQQWREGQHQIPLQAQVLHAGPQAAADLHLNLSAHRLPYEVEDEASAVRACNRLDGSDCWLAITEVAGGEPKFVEHRDVSALLTDEGAEVPHDEAFDSFRHEGPHGLERELEPPGFASRGLEVLQARQRIKISISDLLCEVAPSLAPVQLDMVLVPQVSCDVLAFINFPHNNRLPIAAPCVDSATSAARNTTSAIRHVLLALCSAP